MGCWEQDKGGDAIAPYEGGATTPLPDDETSDPEKVLIRHVHGGNTLVVSPLIRGWDRRILPFFHRCTGSIAKLAVAQCFRRLFSPIYVSH